MIHRVVTTLAVVALAAPLALGAMAAPASPQGAATVEDYTQLPAVSQVRISPNGNQLAYIALVGDKRRLMVKALTGELLAAVDLGVQKVREIRWADDNHLLIMTAYYGDLGGMTTYKSDFYTVQSFNIATKKFVLLLNDSKRTTMLNDRDAIQMNVVMGPPAVRMVNGQRAVFVTGFNRTYSPAVYQVDLDTGIATPKPRIEGLMDATGDWVAKDEVHDGTEPKTYTWQLMRRDGAGAKVLWNATGFTVEGPSLLGMGRTDQSVLVSYPSDDGDELWEVQLADGSRKKLQVGDLGEHAEPIYQPLTGKLLGFQGLVENDFEVYWLDPAISDAWDSILAGYPNDHVRFVSATPDYSKIVVYTFGNSNAGSYLLVDVAAHKAMLAGRAYPNIQPSDIATVQYIHYKAADGMVIPAYLTFPKGKDPKNLPLIVLPHGGPGARDEPGFDWLAQPIASRGYAVLQPEFRGSTGYGKAHLEAGYGEWGGKMQTDLSDGVRYLAAQGIIDPKRVCIFGWSYGGYAAMAGPTIDPGVYRCAVSMAGVSDLNKMLSWERDRSGGKDTQVMRFWKRFMGASRISDGSLASVSPAQQASKAQVPILLIHGKQDYTVPVEQSEIFAAALKSAGKDVQLVILPNDDHYVDARSASRKQLFGLTIDFLEKYNPPNP